MRRNKSPDPKMLREWMISRKMKRINSPQPFRNLSKVSLSAKTKKVNFFIMIKMFKILGFIS